jgi:UDP-N-acetylmuramoyl-tripeptide--D-alanyl-D-alanine ligase
MKKLSLQIILGFLTKLIIKRYKPKIIAVTGSVGKTSTKEAIEIFLKEYFYVKKSIGNLNTEFGAPLIFIGKESGGGSSFLKWIEIILSGLKLVLIKKERYPEIIIVEMGADKPGDIDYLTKIIKPSISVVTFIGETPVHLSNYLNINQLISEKSKIVKVLGKNDFSVLNFDDFNVRNMKNETNSNVIYFGFNEYSDLSIKNLNYEYKEERYNGISFLIQYKESIKKINLFNCYGSSFAYSIASAIACGIALGVEFKKIDSNLFKDLRPEKSRMNLISLKNGAFFIDDTYNASPASVSMAIDVMSSLKADRRILILGDMKELGSESSNAHSKIGELAFGLADILITVGQEAEKIKDRAIEVGFNKKNAYHFKESSEVIEVIKEKISFGDLILVKGSRAMKMEKIINFFIDNKYGS